MFITVSSDYIYLLAMLKTTPLIVTVGLSLTIPLAVIGDWAILDILASPQTIFGATLVVGSFLLLGMEGSDEVADDATLSPDDEDYDYPYEPIPPEPQPISPALNSKERGRSSSDIKALGASRSIVAVIEEERSPSSSAVRHIGPSSGAA